jgi:hypothetical protein
VRASLLLALALLVSTASAEESYSPYSDRSYPTNVYWGDTHVHTHLSADAYILGARLTPDDAYRFAKGEAVTADSGQKVRLRRPLDFLMVADHAENLGVLSRFADGDDSVLTTETGKRWAQAILDRSPPVADILGADTVEAFQRGNKVLGSLKGGWKADHGSRERFRRSVWEQVGATAERHNDPGHFTAFIGFEWSGTGRGPAMIHRNVLFEGGPQQTNQILPFSSIDSDYVEDLWDYLRDYGERVGGRALAIPHNGNLSRGAMFALTDDRGLAFTVAYAKSRARWEPLYEVTQIKGDGETHPILSPTDEFADYETWPPQQKVGAADAEKQKAAEYARAALKLGLDQMAALGVNPFEFGMIGSTDSHTALATAAEDNFWGKMALNEPSPYRAASQWMFSGSGYAAVWAEENTRASLFAAMKRRETYATTGPRMTVRFFGGWDYAGDDALRPDLARVGYAKGVPMGGRLAPAPDGQSPSFLIAALKDPDGANLDRVQVIKGWRDQGGELHELVYNVALSDGRTEDRAGQVRPVGSTVDVKNATYTNSIGDPELAVVWVDPDFEQEELAFYYLRVLEIPTPRWTAYDAKFYNLKDLPEGIPMVTRERAYTSPIWYTPD